MSDARNESSDVTKTLASAAARTAALSKPSPFASELRPPTKSSSCVGQRSEARGSEPAACSAALERAAAARTRAASRVASRTPALALAASRRASCKQTNEGNKNRNKKRKQKGSRVRTRTLWGTNKTD